METMKRKKLSDDLRAIILSCGESRYSLWKETGIDQATLSRFVNGSRSLTLANLDILADHLNLQLTPRKPRPRSRKGR